MNKIFLRLPKLTAYASLQVFLATMLLYSGMAAGHDRIPERPSDMPRQGPVALPPGVNPSKFQVAVIKDVMAERRGEAPHYMREVVQSSAPAPGSSGMGSGSSKTK